MFVEICLFSVAYTALRLVMWYFSRVKAHRKFAERGIPGPKPSLFDGNLNELRKNKEKMPHEVMGEWLNKYGDVVGYYLGEQRHLIINDLDTLQQIFISNTRVFRNRPGPVVDAKPIIYSVVVLRDESWRRVRRVISPVFSNSKVVSPVIYDVIESCVDRLVAKVESHRKNSDPKSAFEAEFYSPMQATSLGESCC